MTKAFFAIFGSEALPVSDGSGVLRGRVAFGEVGRERSIQRVNGGGSSPGAAIETAAGDKP